MGGSSSRANVASADGKAQKVVAFRKSHGFDKIKEQMAMAVYGASAKNVSAPFVRIASRNVHGDFDIDSVGAIPTGPLSLIVVRLLEGAEAAAAAADEAKVPEKHALPKPGGGFRHKDDTFDEAKVPEVKRVDNATPPDKVFPLVVLGSSNVGKTSLIQRYRTDTFSPTHISTMGVACEFVSLTVGDVVIKIRISDTAGQDRFRSIAESHLPTAKGILILFDVTDAESFAHVAELAASVREKAPRVYAQGLVLLVGNKVDRTSRRVVTNRMAAEYAEKIKMPYFETSARDGVGIDPPFQYLATKLLNLYPKRLATFNTSTPSKTGGGGGRSTGRCAIM